MVGNDIGSVPRHEQAPEVRIQSEQVSGKVTAVHPGMTTSVILLVDAEPMILGKSEGFARCTGGQDGITKAIEHIHCHGKDHWLGIHQQDGFSGPLQN